MERVDFNQVKLVPIASVLAHYNVPLKKSGQFLVATKCPLPTHTSEEIETFKVSIKENWFTCFSQSCRAALGKNGGDVIDLVKVKDGLSNLEAAKKLTALFCLNQNAPREAERDGTRVSPKDLAQCNNTSSLEICNKPLGFTLPTNPEHEMIQSRGISVATAKDWGVGYYEDRRQGTASMHQRIIFPLMEDGSLVGYIGRGVRDDQEPRWKFGAKHKTMVFGIERCDPIHPLIICESAWAPLWFAERGKQCASILGKDLTEAQEKRLEPFTTIVVALDNDTGGKEAAAKIVDRLKRNHKVIKAFLKEG